MISLKKEFESLAPKITSSTDSKLAKLEADVQRTVQEAQKIHETQNSALRTLVEGDLQLIREYIGEIDATSRALTEARTMQEKAERVRNDKMVLMILEQKLQALDAIVKDSMTNSVNKLESAIQVLKEETERRCDGIDGAIKKTNDDLRENVQQITVDLQLEKMTQEVLLENLETDIKGFKNKVSEEFNTIHKNQDQGQKNLDEALSSLRSDVEIKSTVLNTRIEDLRVQAKDDLTANVATLNERMDKQVSDYNQKLGQNTEELSNELNDLHSAFETSKTTFEESISNLRDAIDNLEAAVEVMDDDFVKRMAEQKQSLNSKINATESNLSTKIDKVGESCSQILTRMADNLEKTAEDLSNEIQASSYLSKTYISAIESQISDKFESTDSELVLISNQVQKLQGDLEGLAIVGQSDNKSLLAEIQKTLNAIGGVIREQEKAKSHFNDFKSEAEANLKQHSQVLDTHDQKLTDLQNSVIKLDGNIAETNVDVSSLKEGQVTTNNAVSRIDAELETCEQMFGKLSDYINSVESRITTESLTSSASLALVEEQTNEQISIIAKEIEQLNFSLSAVIEPQLNKEAANTISNLANMEERLQDVISKTNVQLEQKLKDFCTAGNNSLSDQFVEKLTSINQRIDEHAGKIGQVAENTATIAKEQFNIKGQLQATSSKITQEMDLINSKLEDEVEKLYLKLTEEAVNTQATNLLDSVMQKAQHEQLVANFNGLVSSLAES